MAKPNGNVLALPPTQSSFPRATPTDLASQPVNRQPRKRERQIINLSQEQCTVMELTAGGAQLGMTLIGKVHEHASQTFEETTAFIVDTRSRPGRDEEHQAYIDQFSLSQVQLCAQQMLAVIDVGATGIGREIHRSLYPPPDEQADGFWARLFSRRED